MVNRTTVETCTARNRRINPRENDRQEGPTRFPGAALKAAPAPRPEHPPAPFGDLTKASVEDLCALATEILRGQTKSIGEKRRQGIRLLFGDLQTLPGEPGRSAGRPAASTARSLRR